MNLLLFQIEFSVGKPSFINLTALGNLKPTPFLGKVKVNFKEKINLFGHPVFHRVIFSLKTLPASPGFWGCLRG